jgi:hypothetical protein
MDVPLVLSAAFVVVVAPVATACFVGATFPVGTLLLVELVVVRWMKGVPLTCLCLVFWFVQRKRQVDFICERSPKRGTFVQ